MELENFKISRTSNNNSIIINISSSLKNIAHNSPTNKNKPHTIKDHSQTTTTTTTLQSTTTLSTTSTTTSTKKSTSSSGFKQIAKNDISAPTNFRHVVCGYDDLAQSRLLGSAVPAGNHGLPNLQASSTAAAAAAGGKSSSLSSSSSSSSSILHSPNSPSNTSAAAASHQPNEHHSNTASPVSPHPPTANLINHSVLYNSEPFTQSLFIYSSLTYT